jgi:hypothetical protein
MNARYRASVLAAALAACAAPVMAQDIYYAPPTTTYYYAPATTTYYYTQPATTYYYTEPAATYYYTPVVTERVYEAPQIIVTAPYMTEDQRITSDVVDVLANDPRLSGKIGVETRNNDVTLSGVVTTPGQARRAARDAQGVYGVRNVTNDLGTRVGGSP